MGENESETEQIHLPEWYRETGKTQLKSEDSAERSEGVKNILKAYSMHDVEAIYVVGTLMLRGALRPATGDPEEQGLHLLCLAARKGYPQARSLLNQYCKERYEKNVGIKESTNRQDGPLVDFDGVPITLNRKGVFTPIDAVLEYVDGVNVLTLSANVYFMYDGTQGISDPKRFEEAVLTGIREWEGTYKVFNHQSLRLVLDITTEPRMFDNVIVMPLTDSVGATIQKIADAVGTKNVKQRTSSVIASKRSFASAGSKWSVHSRKLICIQSESGRFDDYEEIKHVVKHEFGHALGLGDLYKSQSDQLSGVEKGTYHELDGYYVTDKIYNLVMCDHHGPISNNDVEMVLLAFRENKAQLYQPSKFKGKISSALGKGN